MNDDRTTAEKKRKLYFILTVAEIVIGIAVIFSRKVKKVNLKCATTL